MMRVYDDYNQQKRFLLIIVIINTLNIYEEILTTDIALVKIFSGYLHENIESLALKEIKILGSFRLKHKEIPWG